MHSDIIDQHWSCQVSADRPGNRWRAAGTGVRGIGTAFAANVFAAQRHEHLPLSGGTVQTRSRTARGQHFWNAGEYLGVIPARADNIGSHRHGGPSHG
jgi:hypothetical protein